MSSFDRNKLHQRPQHPSAESAEPVSSISSAALPSLARPSSSSSSHSPPLLPPPPPQRGPDESPEAPPPTLGIRTCESLMYPNEPQELERQKSEEVRSRSQNILAVTELTTAVPRLGVVAAVQAGTSAGKSTATASVQDNQTGQTFTNVVVSSDDDNEDNDDEKEEVVYYQCDPDDKNKHALNQNLIQKQYVKNKYNNKKNHFHGNSKYYSAQQAESDGVIMQQAAIASYNGMDVGFVPNQQYNSTLEDLSSDEQIKQREKAYYHGMQMTDDSNDTSRNTNTNSDTAQVQLVAQHILSITGSDSSDAELDSDERIKQRAKKSNYPIPQTSFMPRSQTTGDVSIGAPARKTTTTSATASAFDSELPMTSLASRMQSTGDAGLGAPKRVQGIDSVPPKTTMALRMQSGGDINLSTKPRTQPLDPAIAKTSKERFQRDSGITDSLSRTTETQGTDEQRGSLTMAPASDSTLLNPPSSAARSPSANNDNGALINDTNTVASSIILAPPPDLARDGRFQPRPGAVRVQGFYTMGSGQNNNDDFASADFTITGQNHDDDYGGLSLDDALDNDLSSPGLGNMLPLPGGSSNPIEAVLVSEEEDAAKQEENRRAQQELEEREAKLRQRELELERQLAQLKQQQTPQVVVAAAVIDPPIDDTPPTNTKQKKGKLSGIRSLFSKKSPKPDAKKSPKAAIPPVFARGTSGGSHKSDASFNSSSSLRNIAVETEMSIKGSPATKAAVLSSSMLSTSSSTDFAVFDSKSLLPNAPTQPIAILDPDEVTAGRKLSASNPVVGTDKDAKWNQVMTLTGVHLNDDSVWDHSTLFRTKRQKEKEPMSQSVIRHELQKSVKLGGKGNKYVMKQLDTANVATDDQATATMALCSEINLLSKLDHDCIIKVRGISSCVISVASSRGRPSTGHLFYVMNRLEDTLFDRIDQWKRRQWRSLSRTSQDISMDQIKIGNDLASALDYLHKRNIIYADLKPENIGFLPSGQLQLFNFGRARLLQNAKKPYDVTCPTTSAIDVGTHPYMPPEVAFSITKMCGLNIDTYGFGILLWEVITMKEPFADLMIHEYLEQVLRKHQRPKVDHRVVPDELHMIMTACWHPDARKRPSMGLVYPKLNEYYVAKQAGSS